MTDKTTMSFTLNQAALNAAIGAEMPRFLRELDFDYTSGREPKGLTAQVTVNEAMIRQAVTSHARKTVNASFNHFAISFKATRGDDGITTTVVASNSPIEAEDEAASKAAPRAAIQTEEPATSTEAVAADAAITADVVEAEAEDVAETAQNTEQSEAATDEVATESADGPAEAPAPARSKLFAGLKRPDNSAPAE